MAKISASVLWVKPVLLVTPLRPVGLVLCVCAFAVGVAPAGAAGKPDVNRTGGTDGPARKPDVNRTGGAVGPAHERDGKPGARSCLAPKHARSKGAKRSKRPSSCVCTTSRPKRSKRSRRGAGGRRAIKRSCKAPPAFPPLSPANIGLADNHVEAFADPRLRASGITRMRKQVYLDDTVRGGRWLFEQDVWFALARELGIEPVVTIFHARGRSTYLPSNAEYKRAFHALRVRYPWVKWYSTWNEANSPAQPTGDHPERAAAYYKIARRECGSACKVIAVDYWALDSPRARLWLRKFVKLIGRGPHRWGLVVHPDANGMMTKSTSWFLANTKGPVFINEAGALNVFGPSVKGPRRQNTVMQYLMRTFMHFSPRIERLYVYHWRASPGNIWDSALLNADGTPRPAYYSFFAALGRPAPELPKGAPGKP